MTLRLIKEDSTINLILDTKESFDGKFIAQPCHDKT